MKRGRVWVVLCVLIAQVGVPPAALASEPGGSDLIKASDNVSTKSNVAAEDMLPPGLDSPGRSEVPVLDFSREQDSPELSPKPLLPGEITPPENCGVPLTGPFGKDEEVFRGGEEGLGYDFSPTWHAPGCITNPSPVTSNIVAAAVNSEKIVAVWNNGSGLIYDTWTGSWSGSPTALSASPQVSAISGSGSPVGNPVVMPAGGDNWEVYTRMDNGQIQYSTWVSPTLTISETLSGVNSPAASDPAVVAMDPQHTLVFYRDEVPPPFVPKIHFTERLGGVWRKVTVPLNEGPDNFVFLPLVSTGMTTSAGFPPAAPENGSASRDDTPTVQPSELSAYSRNANHAAVFYVDEENRLWVREWTHLNNSDWSDTSWVSLMEGVMIEKPAVASRHINHLAVAVRDTAGQAYMIEWTPDLNNTGEAGWETPYSLGKTLAGPLALAATSVESLSVFGSDSAGEVWQRPWSSNSDWADWLDLGVKQLQPGSPLTTVVRRQDDIMLLGNGFESTGSCASYMHFTSQGETPVETTIVPEGQTKGYPRGQALAWVGGKTLWVTAHEEDLDPPQYWQVDALDLGEAVSETLVLQNENHVYTDTETLVYTAAADLDSDGDEEAVVATSYTPPNDDTQISLSVLNFEISPTLSISTLVTEVFTTTIAPPLNFSLAVGDLDGDGVQNELVLAAIKLGDLHSPLDDIQLYVYQYDAQSKVLVWKAEKMLPLIIRTGEDHQQDTYQVQVEVETGKLYSNPGQQIVVSDLVRYFKHDDHGWFPDTYAYQVFPTVRTYYVNIPEDPPWTIEPVVGGSITHEDWWSELWADSRWLDNPGEDLNDYSSALDTGDLDADGYDEIALAYANRVIVVEPVGGDQGVQIVQFDPDHVADYIFIDRPERSLAVGDIDHDGRAEILSEMYLIDQPGYASKLNLFEIFGDGTLGQTPTSTYPLPTANDGGRLHAILVGDTDNDSFISELTGCAEYSDVRVVAVLNGVPRWYEDGQPINPSRGSYTVDKNGGTAEERGTKFNIGASLSLGFEQEANIPVLGVNIGEVRASRTRDLMTTHGIRQTTETYNSYGDGFYFEGKEWLGLVIYEDVSSTCYFYNVYSPASPGDTSKAMTCIPKKNPHTTKSASLETWRSPTSKGAAGASWVDVGHRDPDWSESHRSYSNNLAIPGNYPYSLPVDDFMLLFEFEKGFQVKQDLNPDTGTDWTYQQGKGGTFTKFHELNLNTTVSAGITAAGLKVDRSITSGFGFESSQTMTWGESLAFYGRIYNFKDSNRQWQCYDVVPYVYQAKAITEAGVTYPYWEMDYYLAGEPYYCVLAPPSD